MKPVCFVIPFFIQPKHWFDPRPRRMPKYFECFLHSFEKNGLADLKIFTNANIQRSWRQGSTTTEIHRMSFRAFKRLISQKLDINADPITPYKLCDFKPMFGLIFDDYLKPYQFWGYCDIDMVIGHLKTMIPPSALESADLITVSRKIAGYMTLYRNTPEISNLFRRSPDCEKVLHSRKHYCFDEVGNRKGIVAMLQVLERSPDIKVARIEGLVHNDSGSMNVDRDWVYEWQDGHLMDVIDQVEVGSLHLVKSKRRQDFSVPSLKGGQQFNRIQVTPQGIAYG
ncbi:MAG: DUF6625 family protein [Leptolyngbya sp.]|nr:DUF6625 family protein [Leptolyngbya sp.]